jgi:rRNA-processing protein FCF1
LSTIKGKKGISARTALLALKSKKVRVYNINVSADLWITRQASSEKGSIVISNDTELIRALCWKHVPCFKISKSGMLKRTFK